MWQNYKFKLPLIALLSLCAANVCAEEPILQKIEADACDDRQQDYDTKTMEYRAVDKASFSAVKTSGVIQKYAPNLSSAVIDVITYQLIDEYLTNVQHNITHSDTYRTCVHVSADLEISQQELQSLIDEHITAAEPAVINADKEVIMASEVAEEVNKEIKFKPQNLNEKKLVYIADMHFWDNTETNHYTDLLKELFSHSDYYYVTNDKDMADFIITPSLKKAEIDKIDNTNHKMQMIVGLQASSPRDSDFSELNQEQNHFVLFAADKDEQEMADTLIRKLLTRAANDISGKINSYRQKSLEKSKLNKKIK